MSCSACLYRLRRLSQRNSRRQIERQRDHRELPLVIHCQGRVGSLKVAEGRKRHLHPGVGVHVNVLQRIRILRKLRVHFEHHVVLVQLRKNGGDLALPEGVVERVVDGLGQYAQTRRGIAINHQLGLQAAILLIGGDIAHGRQLAQLVDQSRGPDRQLLRVGIFHRILILGAADPIFHRQVLHRLHVQGDAVDLRQFRLQPADNIGGGCLCAGHAASG